MVSKKKKTRKKAAEKYLWQIKELPLKKKRKKKTFPLLILNSDVPSGAETEVFAAVRVIRCGCGGQLPTPRHPSPPPHPSSAGPNFMWVAERMRRAFIWAFYVEKLQRRPSPLHLSPVTDRAPWERGRCTFLLYLFALHPKMKCITTPPPLKLPHCSSQKKGKKKQWKQRGTDIRRVAGEGRPLIC